MKLAVSLLLTFVLSSSSLWAASSPMAQVQEVVDSVLHALSRTDLSEASKQEEMGELVQSSIHLEAVSRKTLGPHWKEASPSQREKYSKLLILILKKTFLSRLEDYSGGRVDYLGERIKGNRAIVTTKFVSETVDLPVRYKMLQAHGNWLIYDVVIEGVSLLKNYRSSYGAIITSKGFDGLLAMLERKLEGVGKTRT